MPLHVETTGSTIFIRRDAFESNGLERGELDQKYNLTDAERVSCISMTISS